MKLLRGNMNLLSIGYHKAILISWLMLHMIVNMIINK